MAGGGVDSVIEIKTHALITIVKVFVTGKIEGKFWSFAEIVQAVPVVI